MTTPPTSIGGNASRLLFKRETQTAFLTNTEATVCRSPSLGEISLISAKLTAKTLTLDWQNSQLKMVDSVARALISQNANAPCRLIGAFNGPP